MLDILLSDWTLETWAWTEKHAHTRLDDWLLGRRIFSWDGQTHSLLTGPVLLKCVCVKEPCGTQATPGLCVCVNSICNRLQWECHLFASVTSTLIQLMKGKCHINDILQWNGFHKPSPFVTTVSVRVIETSVSYIKLAYVLWTESLTFALDT